VINVTFYSKEKILVEVTWDFPRFIQSSVKKSLNPSLMLLQEIPNAGRGTVIDVRTREEYDLGHPTAAVQIPWDLHLYYLDDLAELPKPWMFCCEEGFRSGLVVFSLQMLGFEEVYNVGRWIDVDRERKLIPDQLEEAA